MLTQNFAQNSILNSQMNTNIQQMRENSMVARIAIKYTKKKL